MDIENVLKAIYYEPRNPNSFSTADKLYKAAKEHLPSLTLKQVEDWLSGEFTYTLHKPVRKIFERNPIIVEVIDQQWEADLVDMQEYKSDNNDNKYILTVIDVMSKYAWVEILKDKTANSILKAFKNILKSDRIPYYLRTDQGKEFLNKTFQGFLKKKGIHHFTSKNQDIKCAIVERFNRTLKGRMFKYFTSKGTRKYIDILQDLVIAYNNSNHRTIKMTPIEASKSTSEILFKNIYGVDDLKELYDLKKRNNEEINIEDTVRKRYKLGPFDKSYFPNWTDQIYTVKTKTDEPIKTVYKLDSDDVRLYPEQIQKVKENVYRVEKIIRSKTIDGKKQHYVKWLNYPDSFNSWVNDEDIYNL